MTSEEWKELGLPSDEELKEREDRFIKMEDNGIADTQKYFDRIHDKLFNLNNILIASYFALIAFRNDTPNWILLIPVINTLILLNIDYRMMVRARIQANIRNASQKEIQKYGSIQINTNLHSLVSIYSTIAVVLVFCYFLVA